MAMLRLDHNRAIAQPATRTGKPVSSIEKLVVWGNHSPTTMYPDLRFATVGGQEAKSLVAEETWYRENYIPPQTENAGSSNLDLGVIMKT